METVQQNKMFLVVILQPCPFLRDLQNQRKSKEICSLNWYLITANNQPYVSFLNTTTTTYRPRKVQVEHDLIHEPEEAEGQAGNLRSMATKVETKEVIE